MKINRMFLPSKFTPLSSSQVRNTFLTITGHTSPFSMPLATDLITLSHSEFTGPRVLPCPLSLFSLQCSQHTLKIPFTPRVKPGTKHQVSLL